MHFLLLLLNISFATELDLITNAFIGKSIFSTFGTGAFERGGAIGVRFGGDAWKLQLNSGYYHAPDPLDKSSFYESLQGGVLVKGQGGMLAQVFLGPTYIHNSDDQKISGHWQFHLTTGAGIISESGYSLCMVWQHFSNAGLLKDENGKMLPNNGRDLITLQLGIPLWRN